MDKKDLKYILLTLIWMVIFIFAPVIPLFYFRPQGWDILYAFVYAVGIEGVLFLLFLKFVKWHNKRIEKKYSKNIVL